ncbi:MAG: SUMF1/EgtB/PvdO family nonheme iron enzyme [Gammaproteobacteria bacterium]|nr:SUMF1/EgtB/PvdO family nonheme iron enzyme [Gammaproteobacteria bacterium]MBU1723273.1 SUMF1/EgtB/PvdO family nonheme iron enzyme [Gammaproteobacteria bacterium]MBU2006568.1 SUMF1/EgtB/PvdO family nonheme iron enzyme [Gammaproteobacteria bacterium]
MLRGGSWINNPNNLRSSNRNNNTPDNRNNNLGFRVVCVLTLRDAFIPTGCADHGLHSAAKAY